MLKAAHLPTLDCCHEAESKHILQEDVIQIYNYGNRKSTNILSK